MTENQLIEIIKALSVNSRLQIVKLIGNKRFCVNAIARKLTISQSAVSQHLKVLKDCNIVYPERLGTIIHYQLNKKTIADFTAAFTELLSTNNDTNEEDNKL